VTKYQVIVEPQAEHDIEQAYLWISAESAENANKWFNGIYKAIVTLETFPTRCPFAPENSCFEDEIRQLFYGKRIGRYRILFTIEGFFVHVLHVRHGRRRRVGEWEADITEEN